MATWDTPPLGYDDVSPFKLRLGLLHHLQSHPLNVRLLDTLRRNIPHGCCSSHSPPAIKHGLLEIQSVVYHDYPILIPLLTIANHRFSINNHWLTHSNPMKIIMNPPGPARPRWNPHVFFARAEPPGFPHGPSAPAGSGSSAASSVGTSGCATERHHLNGWMVVGNICMLQHVTM